MKKYPKMFVCTIPKRSSFNCSFPNLVNWQTTGFSNENPDTKESSNSLWFFCSEKPNLVINTIIDCNNVELRAKRFSYIRRRDNIQSYLHIYSNGQFARLKYKWAETFGFQKSISFSFTSIEKRDHNLKPNPRKFKWGLYLPENS